MPRRLTATLDTPRTCAVFSCSDSMARILTGRPAGASSSSSPRADRAGRQRPGHDRAAAGHAERPVHPQPDRGGRVRRRQPRGQLGQRRPQLRQALAGHRADRDRGHAGRGWSARSRRRPGAIGRPGVGEVGPRYRQQPAADAQRVDRGQVLGGLRHPALVGRHHEQHGGHRPDAGQHVRHEPLVAGHVHERQPLTATAASSQAKPRSIVRPRRRSSAQRSGSIPVSARTSVDLPWST